MSATSIDRAANDPDLRKRVEALVWRIMADDPDKSDSEFGRCVRLGMTGMPAAVYWAVAVDTEAAYESAVLAGRGAPGHDVDVITDQAIEDALVEAWPPDPEAPPVVLP